MSQEIPGTHGRMGVGAPRAEAAAVVVRRRHPGRKPRVGGTRAEPAWASAWEQGVAAVLLLIASILQVLAEVIRWEICRGAFWSPACSAWADDLPANNYVVPEPAWTGDPASALLYGAGTLLIAYALHVLLLGRIGPVWKWTVVGPTAFCGVLTLASGITGHGSVVNAPGTVLWILVLPVLYLVAFFPVAVGTPHPGHISAAAVLGTLAVTSSPLIQLYFAAMITNHHDVAAWFGLVHAIPIGAAALATFAGAVLRKLWLARGPGGKGPGPWQRNRPDDGPSGRHGWALRYGVDRRFRLG